MHCNPRRGVRQRSRSPCTFFQSILHSHSLRASYGRDHRVGPLDRPDPPDPERTGSGAIVNSVACVPLHVDIELEIERESEREREREIEREKAERERER